MRDRAPTAFKSSCTSIRRSSRSNQPPMTEPHRCELEDGPALALDTARRLACDCDDRRHRRRRGRRAARHRAQDAQHSCRDQPRAESARRRLPFPRLRSHALLRRAPHQALGERRGNEARQPDHALRLPPSARARRRLWSQANRRRAVRLHAAGRPARRGERRAMFPRKHFAAAVRAIAASKTACATI